MTAWTEVRRRETCSSEYVTAVQCDVQMGMISVREGSTVQNVKLNGMGWDWVVLTDGNGAYRSWIGWSAMPCCALFSHQIAFAPLPPVSL